MTAALSPNTGAPRRTVVINAFSARRGGGQTYLLNLLEHLDHGAVSAVVLAPEELELPQGPGIRRVAVRWPTQNPFLRTLWERLMLPGLLKELGADVLFCPGGLINTRPPKGCRTATMFRNMIPFDPAVRSLYAGKARLRNWLLERGMLSSMRQADLVIFLSDYARGVIEERCGGRIGGARTIPHGIAEHFRVAPESPPQRPAWLPEGEYLLYVSLFEAYKHHLEVVRGYRLLRARRPTPEKLVLAGHLLEPQAAAVRREIERAGLENEVILAGAVRYRELPALYAGAKINLFASSCENCPNILLEALGAGRPLLVSHVPPMPEFAGDAALYFDPREPQELAQVLAKMIDDNELLTEYAHRARRRAELYDWKSTAQETWRALQSL